MRFFSVSGDFWRRSFGATRAEARDFRARPTEQNRGISHCRHLYIPGLRSHDILGSMALESCQGVLPVAAALVTVREPRAPGAAGV